MDKTEIALRLTLALIEKMSTMAPRQTMIT